MNIYIKILLLLLFANIAVSCYDDNSKLDDDSIPEYIIMLENKKDISNRISVIYGEKLNVNPRVYRVNSPGDTTKNLNDTDVSFEWMLNQDPMNNDTTRRVIATTQKLDVIIKDPPSSGRYNLSLNVIDKKTGLKVIKEWNLMINTVFNNGLLVASTKDNGVNSDISLVMSNELSDQLDGEGETKIIHNVYSSINKEFIKGEIKIIKITYPNDEKAITLICPKEKSMYRMMASDFILVDKNQENFYLPEKEFAPMGVGNGYSQLLLINNGKINIQDYQQVMEYQYPLESDEKGYYCTQVATSLGDGPASGVAGILYDELNGRFLKIPAKFSPQVLKTFNVNNGGAFDMTNLKDKTCLKAAYLNGKYPFFIMKDKNTGKIEFYETLAVATQDNGQMGAIKIDASSIENIDKSISFVIADKENVVYYATPENVYAIILDEDHFTVEKRYTVESQEKITCFDLSEANGKVHVEAHYDDEGEIEWWESIYPKRRMLLIATYNSSTNEGIIRANYIEGLGAGVFSNKYKWKYTGFDKITALGAIYGQW